MAPRLFRRAPAKTNTFTGTVDPAPARSDKAEIGSSIAAPIRDIVPDLMTHRTANRTFYQMSQFHAATRASLRAVKSSVLGADYYFEPCDENQDQSDMVDFLTDCFFEAPGTPWLMTLSRVMKMLEYGWSFMEPVYENRNWTPDRKGANSKVYTMLRKLAPRPVTTVTRIDYDDNGGPTQIVQQALRGAPDYKIEEVIIPIEKAIIFTNDEDGGDLAGHSILRSAYPHWYYIQHLYKIDAIQKERHGIGIPRAHMPPGIKSEKEKQTARQMVKDIRTNEHAGIVEPDGWLIDFIKPEGQMVNVLQSVEHHNGMIMLNVLAEFLIAGLQATGGGARAVSASQQDIFMKTNRGFADTICDTFNMYLIPRLMNYNFETEEYPKLRVRNLGDTRDMQQFAAGLANMFDKEIITPDLETEQWARRVFEMPAKQGDRPALSANQIREVIQAQAAGPSGASGPGNTGNGSTVKNNGGQGNMGKGNNVS